MSTGTEWEEREQYLYHGLGIYHFSVGDEVRRLSDGIEGVVISRTVHWAKLRLENGQLVEIEQLTTEYTKI